MLKDKKNRQLILIQNESGGDKRYGETTHINMIIDVHIEVSRARGFDITIKNHVKCTVVIENKQIWK
jgi:hypothetical protein